MPTITFSLNDLSKLIGRKLSQDKLVWLLEYAKAELESITGDEASIKLNDTNLPYLWSVEGLARLFKGVLGAAKGIPKLKAERTGLKLFVESSVRPIRPYIAAFAAKGQKIDDYLLKQLIQLQEKICDGYGRRRQKLAIGLYPFKKIEFPVYYKAVHPSSTRFTPLDFRTELNLWEIVKEHPKGREYGGIVEGQKKWPILIDSKKEVLSFPPIINSATTGKLEVGESEIFFEATATDLASARLAASIFAQAFADRGFKIYSVDIKYPDKLIVTPDDKNEKVRFDSSLVQKTLGLELKESEIKSLLERARYSVDKNVVEIPSYRQDIMHPLDIVEDVAIMYGFENIESSPLTSYTVGSSAAMSEFADKLRQLATGLGYQEIMSPILSNKEQLYEKMEQKDSGTIEISNFTSQTYSCVRSWLLPIMMEVLSKNKHSEYPQRIFEQGLVTQRNGGEIFDTEKLAAASCHANADFTEAKQLLDALLRPFAVNYSVEETEKGSFILGRVAKVVVAGKEIGIIGEIHPQVLVNWGLETPVAAIELNLTELKKLISL